MATTTDAVAAGLHRFDESALPRRRARWSFAATLTAVYLAISLAWIVLSDRLVTASAQDLPSSETLQTVKGLGFVVVSAAVLYVAVSMYARQSRRARRDLEQAWDETLLGWALAMDAREAQLASHSQRVADLTVALARQLGVPAKDLRPIYRGALLHDIGKLGVPEAILSSREPLTDEQWVLIRQHPDNARRILEPIAFLADSIDIPYCHHERWNGSGYPRGLAGTEIPLWARIFAVADVYDALTVDRPYHSRISHDAAVAIIRDDAGVLLDPEVVDAFEELMTSRE